MFFSFWLCPSRLGKTSSSEKWRKVKDKDQAMRILGIGSNVNEAEGAKPVGRMFQTISFQIMINSGASLLLHPERHTWGFPKENQGESCDKEAHRFYARRPRVLPGDKRKNLNNGYLFRSSWGWKSRRRSSQLWAKELFAKKSLQTSWARFASSLQNWIQNHKSFDSTWHLHIAFFLV